ncbi:nitric oxide reductase activation protein NorD [Marinimicrobium locisalis]|uniref:nitric oxide reductase activation protein NorD n=1 Tax=Marinimicrobium locisalis TaxID=546022 RepID=UPI0032215873
MAEAEEVITDAARHATVFAQNLWRRHRTPPNVEPTVTLDDVATRLDLFVTAVFGDSYSIRRAQLPARATLLSIVFKRHQKPRLRRQIPATDGTSLWLPPDSFLTDVTLATQLYRVMALQQAVRARRGSATAMGQDLKPLVADVYLLLEAYATDELLAALLPGMVQPINTLRRHALAARPPLSQFPKPRQPLEMFLRRLLQSECGAPCSGVPLTDAPEHSMAQAREIIRDFGLVPNGFTERHLGPFPLVKDWWTGELRCPPPVNVAPVPVNEQAGPDGEEDSTPPRGAHLARRPEEREAEDGEDEDEEHHGPWMVQMDEPHQHAEDPMGLQRPTDRDEETSAEEFGDLVSELPEARLVSTPGRPKEVLLSDDPPDARARQELKAAVTEGRGISYPEWDYQAQVYREHGATVRLLSIPRGSQQWVDETMEEHESMLHSIRRRFEMLSARRVWQRKQLDGDEIDLDAYIDSYADFQAGNAMAEALYQTRRTADRNTAITLLIDISGSTDSWVSANRRIIDVEREALLLVCIALEGLGEPYSVQAFSGEGPHSVTVRQIKAFDEAYSNDVALRISSLEPQHYTRTGAAIRHASVDLMRQPAAHRLLLLLSDGKPNDKDNYEGRYGVEDMRQAVTEASLQGISPFCLTIDRQAANYLPRIFGAHHYALLPKPELLPQVLLDWMKRLVAS